MRRVAWCLFGAMGVGWATVGAESQLQVGPVMQYSRGGTEYFFDWSGVDEDGAWRHTSLLEFPLDVFHAGANARLIISGDGRPRWEFDLLLAAALSNPERRMYDTDWSTERTGNYEKYSYTESEAEGRSLRASLTVSRVFYGDFDYDFRALAGLRYHRIDQDIVGYSGWRIDPRTGAVVEIGRPDVVVIEYTQDLVMPFVGLGMQARFSERLSATVTGSYVRVFASDRDDHVLRTKLATADATGNGLLATARVDLSVFPEDVRPFSVVFDSELLTLATSGEQYQYWYGDADVYYDYEVGEYLRVPQGYEYIDLPHDINSTLFYAGVRLLVWF